MNVTNWNVEENRDWYIRLADSGTDIVVELYISEANAQSQTDRRSFGSAAYGTDVECTLTADTGYSVDYFQEDYTWHLRVSGQNGDSAKIYKMNAFTDLPSIAHAIFKNNSLITIKSTYEINIHTKYKTVRRVPLGIHIPALSVGKIVNFNSTRRGVTENNQIETLTISGTVDSLGSAKLANNVELIKFSNLNKV